MVKTSTTPAQQGNISYFRNWYGSTTLEEYKTLKIVKGVNQYDKLVMAAWMGKQKDPFSRYSYQIGRASCRERV